MIGLYNTSFNDENDKIWKVAIYARLSREDEKDERFSGQSESIENQIKFLKPIISKSRNWILIDIYYDDGYTGTNFDRPNFQRMMRDVDKGLVNLIITKDLSRLGRDYIEVGNYVEKVFPEKNVRYIAVNDNIDTFDRKNTNNDMTPFKSVMNDFYAKDISNKVRSSIYTKAREGDCIKAFMSYGYKKDFKDKNVILIDEDVSGVVEEIFDLFIEGKNKAQIARILNDRNIDTPMRHKELTSNYANPNKNCTYKWNVSTISKILKDRSYIGDLIQLKYNKVNYKIKKVLNVPKNEQIVIQNHHPAIISKEKFDLVQEILVKRANEWNYSDRKRHLLTGLVYCTCGSRITYNLNHGKTFRCVCNSYKKYGNKFCHSIHLKEDELINKTSSSLKKNINDYLKMDELKYKKLNSKKDEYKTEIQSLMKNKEKQNEIIANLYENKIAGVISEDTFNTLIKKYENQKKEIEGRIQLLQDRQEHKIEEPVTEKNMKNVMNEILKFDSINEENITLVFKLIDKIIIDDKKIIIQYKFNAA